MKKSYYEILNIPPYAQLEEIKKAYRGLAKKYHPDKNLDLDTSEIFKSIQTAYEILSDPDKRKSYDESLKDEAQASHNHQKREEDNPRPPKPPVNAFTGKKNYKYYRSSKSIPKDGKSIEGAIPISYIPHYKAHIFLKRFVAIFIFNITFCAFILLPIWETLTSIPLNPLVYYVKIPLIFQTIIFLVDTRIKPTYRIGKITSWVYNQNSIEDEEDFHIKHNVYGKSVTFNISNTTNDLIDDIEPQDSMIETIDFPASFTPENVKYKFYYSPLMNFCQRISTIHNTNASLIPSKSNNLKKTVYFSLILLFCIIISFFFTSTDITIALSGIVWSTMVIEKSTLS